jgi:MraZ protein
MFLGFFEHNLDERGRLMIPARFRDLLEGGAFITHGFDRCLMVMDRPYFGQVYDRINGMNLADPSARLLRRMMFSNAYLVEVDKVGRILIPPSMRTFVGLNGEAIVAGQGAYFEVWAPAAWQAQMTELEDTETNNRRFAALDLSQPTAE